MLRKFTLIIQLFLVCLLAACSTQPQAPESTAIAAAATETHSPSGTPRPTVTLLPTTVPIATTLPAPTETTVPTATALPTALPLPTAEPTEEPVPKVTLEPTATSIPSGFVDTSDFVVYPDAELDLTVPHPADWSVFFINDTTIFSDADGEPQIYVRQYLSPAWRLPAERLIRQIIRPNEADQLRPMAAPFNGAYYFEASQALYLVAADRAIGFESLSEDAMPIMRSMVRDGSFGIVATRANFDVVSSTNWFVEMHGGGTDDLLLTATRRDGSWKQLIHSEPGAQGLGYALTRPLFFSPDEQYVYYQFYGVADGCGLFFGSGDLHRFDLATGADIVIENTAGANHVLSPDGATVTFVRRNDVEDAKALVIHDLTTGDQRVIEIPFEGNGYDPGGLIYSADRTRIAFATGAEFCGGGWQIGIIDLESELVELFPVGTALAFYQPVAWNEALDMLVLQQRSSDMVYYLNTNTGSILAEAPTE